MSIDSTNLSLPGLSGYDFSGIVSKLVQVYSMPEQKMLDEQSALQIKKDAWRDVNTRLQSLDSTLTALKDAITWTATTATASSSVITPTTGTNATPGTYTVDVTNVAAAHTVVSAKQAVASDTTPIPGLATTETFTINSIMVTVNSSTAGQPPSLQDFANAINLAGVGVTASVVQTDTSPTNYQLSLVSKKTGTANAMTFIDGADKVLETLGIFDSVTHALASDTTNGTGGTSKAAADAALVVNGIHITSSSNSVTGAISGVTLNLSDKVTGATVTVASDNSVPQKKIQDFVDQYNSTMDFIAQKLSYDKDTKKKGDLFGDAKLQMIQERLRNIVGGLQVNQTSPYHSMSDIGISTSATDYGKSATLSFDTTKFSTAMSTNSQSVANLFGASNGGITPSTASGMANVMHNFLYPEISYNGGIDQTKNNLDTQITDLTTRITDFEEKVKDYQTRMQIKFANLESVLSGLNSQGSWMATQVNALTSQQGSK